MSGRPPRSPLFPYPTLFRSEAVAKGREPMPPHVHFVTYTLRYNQMRSEEHTSELQSRFGISYAVFCLQNKRYLRPSLMTPCRGPSHVTTRAPPTDGCGGVAAYSHSSAGAVSWSIIFYNSASRLRGSPSPPTRPPRN